jgi:hypothetical protein
MKVYCIFEHDNEGRYLQSIWSTEDLAIKALAKIIATAPDDRGRFYLENHNEIEEREVDSR